MKKALIVFISIHFSLLTLNAQYSQFQVAIGGTGTDVAHSIIQTSDGGYALGGYSWSFGGGSNAYIVKLSASGSLEWTRTFGGTGWDDISSIIQTTDGGYIAAGSSIFKLDSNGTLEWCENISGYGNSIVQTSDGGYVIAGYTNTFGAGNYDMFIVKLNNSGTLQWAKTIGGTNTEYALSIDQTTDGGYIVAGNYWSCEPPYGFVVIKLDNTGITKWARIFYGSKPNSIIQTTDGGYVVASRIQITDYNFYIVKLDSNGVLQWTRTVGLRGGEIPNSLIQTSDGGYAITGYTQYVEGYPDWYIVKLDSTGTLVWSRVVGGGTSTLDKAFSIIRTIDGGYAVTGTKDTYEPAGDMHIVKYDSNWNTCSSDDSLVISYTGSLDTISNITPTVTSPTGFITPRSPVGGSGGTATITCVTGIQPISKETPVSYKLYQNYPNPFNPLTKIKFDIPANVKSEKSKVKILFYDILGREIAVLVNKELKPGSYEVEWNGAYYPSGVYFYKLTAGDYSETRKMVLLK